MPASFQLRIAARVIAILGLVAFGADGAIAQTAPQLRLAALGSTETVADAARAPSLETPQFAVANSPLKTQLPDYFDRHNFSSIADNTAYPSNCDCATTGTFHAPSPVALGLVPNLSAMIRQTCKARNAADPVDTLSSFIAAYISLRQSLDVRAPSLISGLRGAHGHRNRWRGFDV